MFPFGYSVNLVARLTLPTFWEESLPLFNSLLHLCVVALFFLFFFER